MSEVPLKSRFRALMKRTERESHFIETHANARQRQASPGGTGHGLRSEAEQPLLGRGGSSRGRLGSSRGGALARLRSSGRSSGRSRVFAHLVEDVGEDVVGGGGGDGLHLKFDAHVVVGGAGLGALVFGVLAVAASAGIEDRQERRLELGVGGEG